MKKWIVTYTRIPTNYNQPESLVVEAEHEAAAQAIVKDHLRDFALGLSNYRYEKPRAYDPPPAGKILEPASVPGCRLCQQCSGTGGYPITKCARCDGTGIERGVAR